VPQNDLSEMALSSDKKALEKAGLGEGPGCRPLAKIHRLSSHLRLVVWTVSVNLRVWDNSFMHVHSSTTADNTSYLMGEVMKASRRWAVNAILWE